MLPTKFDQNAIFMVQDVIEQIDALFHAKSLAAFGVSAKGGKLGNILLQSYLDIGFEGDIIPIHPSASEVMGLNAYSNLKEYGKAIDLAIIALHPAKVFDAVKDCVENGKAKGIIIFSSGFGEQNAEGKTLANQIVEYAKSHGTRIIGPNCMGLYSPSTKLAFFPGLSKEVGQVAFISQSGSLASHLAYASLLRGISFSKIVSCGNGADLDVSDFLEYLGQDSETKIITGYIEGVKEGNRFVKIAKKVSQKKPIIIWKVGDTPGGKRAAQSHTGSISGDSALWERMFNQAGIVRVNNLHELIEHIGAFINPYFPDGNQVVIISGPGGPAVSSADACEKAGLKLASLTSETKQEMAQIIPEFGTSVKNPIDLSLAVAFDSGLITKATSITGQDPNVDCILIYLSILQKAVVKGLLRVQEKIRKPIALISSFDPITSLEGAEGIKNLFQPIRPRKVPQTLRKLNEKGISVYLTEQGAAKALSALWNYQKFLQNKS